MASLAVVLVLFVIAAGVNSVHVRQYRSNPDVKKPLDCQPDEKYYECSLEQCYTECKHLKSPPACPSIAPGCFKPACLCKDELLRNSEGVCVPIDKCS